MENKIQKADIQLVDSYVKDSSIKIHKRPKKNNNELQLELEVRMSPIKEVNDSNLEANLILIQDLKMFDKESKELMIELSVHMLGRFIGTNLKEEEFVEMIKYNGTPLLSQLSKSYITTITSVGGINPIRIPMINFVEFFKNEGNKTAE